MQVVLNLEIEQNNYIDKILDYLNDLKIKIKDIQIENDEVKIINNGFRDGELVKQGKLKTMPIEELLDEL